MNGTASEAPNPAVQSGRSAGAPIPDADVIRRVRILPNGYLLAGMCVLLIAVGLFRPSPAALAIGVVLGGVVAAIPIRQARRFGRLRLSREYQERLFVDEPLAIHWTLTATDGPIGRTLGSAGLNWEERCALQRTPRADGYLGLPDLRAAGYGARAESIELMIPFEPERGRGVYEVGPAMLRQRDRLGLAEVSLAIPGSRPVRVFPRPFPEDALTDGGASPLLHPPHQPQPSLGTGLDFAGVREYQPGDPPKRVHWRATAKLGSLIVAEFDDTVRTHITIIIDLSRQARLGLGEHSTSELAIRLGGTVATMAIEQGHTAQILAAGDEDSEPLHDTGRGHGREQILRIYNQLAGWRARADRSLAEVVALATRQNRIAPGGIAVLIAPSRSLLLGQAESGAGDTFAPLIASQAAVRAIAIPEQAFAALLPGQALDEADAEAARRTAGSLTIQNIDVRFLPLAGVATVGATGVATGAGVVGD